MEVTVFPSFVSGTLRAPSSKSMAIRVIAAAMLAKGKSVIIYPSRCDDAVAMTGIARQMGANIAEKPDLMEITGNINPQINTFNCGESGLAARLMIPLASIFNTEMTVSGERTLMKRHLGNIEEPLKKLCLFCETQSGHLPVKVRGPLKGGEFEVDGSGGSQFISGLLMALPLAISDSKLIVRNLKSIPYIDMTLDVLEKFGIAIKNYNYKTFEISGGQTYRPATIEVEGDWSGAAFPLVAAALSGDLKISGLDFRSKQADRQIMEALAKSGVKLQKQGSEISASKTALQAFEFDATHCPDLFPPLAVLAGAAKGISTIAGVNRLSQKESDRGIVLQHELGKLGIEINLDGDRMIIHGGEINGGTIFSHNDHRIAMVGAISALVATGPVIIQNAECVSKSYPDFYTDLEKVGAKITVSK